MGQPPLSDAHNEAAAPGEMTFSIRTGMNGIVKGKPHVIDDHVEEPAATILPEDVREAEVARYIQGYEAAKAEYTKLLVSVAKLPIETRKETTELLTLESGMLENDSIYPKKIPARIRNKGVTAHRAVFEEMEALKSIISHGYEDKKAKICTADETARPKIQKDIDMCEKMLGMVDHIEHSLMRRVNPDFHPTAIEDLESGVIPVMAYVRVTDILAFANEKGRARLHGAISFKGNNTDHSNIIARGLKILLSRVDEAEFKAIQHMAQQGLIEEIIIDGNKNKLIVNPSHETKVKYTVMMGQQKANETELLRRSQMEDGWTMSRNGVKIKVGANIGHSTDMYAVNDSHAKGVGLCRTELLVLSRRSSFPTEDDWFDFFKEVVESGRNPKTGKTKKITFRTVDFTGDKMSEKLSSYTPEKREAKKEEIIRNQMAAALRVAKYVQDDQIARGMTPKPRVFMMIPNVTSPEELEKYQQMMDAEAARLEAKDHCAYPYIQLGAMVENPGIVRQLRHVKAAFFSIGTNDLIPYTLGYNRFDEDADSKYDPTHPAVLDEIATTQSYQTPDCPVSVCGDMASNPRYFALLIGIGIRNLSVSAAQVPLIKELVRRVDTAEAQALYHDVRAEPSREKREALLDEFNEKYLGLSRDMPMDMNWAATQASAETMIEVKADATASSGAPAVTNE
jgi:phosphotransferase system enzyme I (PtsI)